MKCCLALFFFFLHTSAHAGILEDLSEFSDWTHSPWNHDNCAKEYDETRARDALARAWPPCPSAGPHTESQLENLAKISTRIQGQAEDKYFALLGKHEAKELACSAGFAAQLGSGKQNAAVTQIANSLQLLRSAKQQIVRATKAIMSPGLSAKTCPDTLNELKPHPPAFAGDHDEVFDNCSQLIVARDAYNEIVNSIPLSNVPAINTLLQSYTNSPVDKDETQPDIEGLVSRAYATASDQLADESSKLDEIVARSGGTSFSRGDRYSLLSDPRLSARIIKDAGDDKDLKGLACLADARYHKGADALDTNIAIGSLVAGGIGGRLVGAGASAVLRMSTMARLTGLISVNGMRVLQVGAVIAAGSANALAAYPGIVKACSANAGPAWTAKATDDQGACISTPTVEQTRRDNCILAKSLALIGFQGALGLGLKASLGSGRALLLARNGKRVTVLSEDAAAALPGYQNESAARALTSAFSKVATTDQIDDSELVGALAYNEGSFDAVKKAALSNQGLSQEQRDHLAQALDRAIAETEKIRSDYKDLLARTDEDKGKIVSLIYSLQQKGASKDKVSRLMADAETSCSVP